MTDTVEQMTPQALRNLADHMGWADTVTVTVPPRLAAAARTAAIVAVRDAHADRTAAMLKGLR